MPIWLPRSKADFLPLVRVGVHPPHPLPVTAVSVKLTFTFLSSWWLYTYYRTDYCSRDVSRFSVLHNKGSVVLCHVSTLRFSRSQTVACLFKMITERKPDATNCSLCPVWHPPTETRTLIFLFTTTRTYELLYSFRFFIWGFFWRERSVEKVSSSTGRRRRPFHIMHAQEFSDEDAAELLSDGLLK